MSLERVSCLLLSIWILALQSHSSVNAQTAIAINSPPLILTSGNPLSVSVTYTTSVVSVIVVDVLLVGTYACPATGNLAVQPGTSVTVTIPMSWLNSDVGNTYFYNVNLISKSVYDANPNTAWQNPLIPAVQYPSSQNVIINPKTTTPTSAPTTPTTPTTPTSTQTTTTRPPTTTTTTKPPTTISPTTKSPSTVTVTPTSTPTSPPDNGIQGDVNGQRVCYVKASDEPSCFECGYTICRDSKPLLMMCPTGSSCNAATNQCDRSLTCTNPKYLSSDSNITNDATYIISSTYVVMISVLSIVISYCL